MTPTEKLADRLNAMAIEFCDGALTGFGISAERMRGDYAPIIRELLENAVIEADTLRAIQVGAKTMSVDRLCAAMRDACDVLAERKLASPARSPGHNARLILEAALISPQEGTVPGAADAQRYAYLRSRPDDAIGKGGVFAGMTPETGRGGSILTGVDLDKAIDAAIVAEGGAEPTNAMADGWIDIVFDGPPGPEAGRFVEVENARGQSIRCGDWAQRPDGYWVLRITSQTSGIPCRGGG